ncbi:MAG: CusA/CzcA family heavy metal efflux RND transporter [Flavobacteriales bacterium]|nr:CusA/CzcA family heavy metal efflux RND transporter [Flavobacteriales bacterium]
MLDKIINFSVNNKFIIGLFLMGLIGFGTYQLTKLPIDAVPDITNNQVQVISVAPALGATDIERLITFPIELANSNIPGMHEIRSFSRFGLSIVTIVFDDDIDVYWARQQVAERLLQVQTELPDGVQSVSMGPVTTGLGEIYQYTLRAKEGYENKFSTTDLRTIQDWIVRRQLLGVKGVADVSSFGGKLKQYEIAVEPNKLKAFGITINDVFTALENNNQNTGGAYIEKGPTALFIKSEGLIGNEEDVKSIFIKNTSNGTPLLIRDVAEINIGHATRYGAITYNDQGEVAGAVVMMLKGENSNKVIENVKERIEVIKKTLPEGILLEPFLDRTKMVNNAISTVKTNLMEGALIVLFVLILFLGNFRAGFLVASIIPLAMLFAVIMMNLFGVSGNLMSLGALDFGLIIDGAVIIVESFLHNLRHHQSFSANTLLTNRQMDTEIKHSASKMMNSAVFGQIIILVVYLPIFFLEGIEGKMFKPMVQTVVFALLGAFILSLTYVPMMSALIMSKRISHKQTLSDQMMAFIEKHYERMLNRVLRFPKLVISSAFSLFIIAVFILSQLGGEFIPTLEEGDFAVETRVLTGSNLNTAVEKIKKAAHILLKDFPEVEQVVSKIGSGEIPTDPMPMEAADMMIILKHKSEWTSASTFPELSEKMGAALEAVPGITTGFQYPVQMRFNELMTGAKQDVVCKIFGENIDTLAYYAQQLGTLATSVEGSNSIYVEPVAGMPQITIRYKREAFSQYGLDIKEVNKVVNTGLAGQVAGSLYEDEKRFDIVVRLNRNQLNHVEDIKNLLIPTESGLQIPLYQIADVELNEGPNQIQREDAKRRIIVGFNVIGRDVQSIVEELKIKEKKNIKLPAGYYITYGGAFENLNAAKKRLSITVPISLLLIFILLYFAFQSVKHGLLIYSAIPLSAIGGVFALLLRGMPFSISAGIGFIALFGVAVLNGIVLIAEFNRLKNEGITDKKKIVLKGTKVRLRPVLMTAFVASLGFLPMALSNGSGAEVQRPLATVVIGGLLMATFLTLFVLPVLYILFEKGFTKKVKPSFQTPIILLLVFTSLFAKNNASAQTPINLNAAIDSAIVNNLLLKSERLNVEASAKLKKSAWDLPQTSVNAEYGQFNSIYNDNKIGVTQNIKFPTVYQKQKKILSNEWKNAQLSLEIRKQELKKEVSFTFFNILYLQQQQNLLLGLDSLFTGFLKKAELKLAKGESNLLEKNSAISQQGQIKIQLIQTMQELQNELLEFNVLLHSSLFYTPDTSLKKMLPPIYSDSGFVNTNPIIKQLEVKHQLSIYKTKLEKNLLLPELFVGYNNLSITGMGADDIIYTTSKRFQFIQAGVGIPLFFGSQTAKIKALKINTQIAENNLNSEKEQLQMRHQKALNEYKVHLESILYFENIALLSAHQMSEAAQKQYLSGEINYLEWMMLLNQAISVKSDYLKTLNQYNYSIIELNYITNK